MRQTLFSNLLVSAESGSDTSRTAADGLGNVSSTDGRPRASEFRTAHFMPDHRPHVERLPGRLSRPPLRVMKFGGTSVGDASCISQVAEIIKNSSHESDVVVVVSAMRGVTDRLIEAARHSETGGHKQAEIILGDLHNQHEEAARALIHSVEGRKRIARRMREILDEGKRLCQRTATRRELTPQACDAISSLGERLSAPLVAAALEEQGVVCEAIEASEIVVTDSYHGAAEPWMDPTRERCGARLRPLLERGAIPVITGFIGASLEGMLTTLGRGGSDYSATIVGAALNADEVIIWTDVDGLLTADPRIVPDACTISEISYPEASALAGFGAKVLHPKTLHALTRSGIPVWIRNTFAPKRPGTKITPEGLPGGGGVKALAAIRDAAIIAINGLDMLRRPDLLQRTLAATAKVRANVLLAWQSISQDDIYLAAPLPAARRAAEALQCEFKQELGCGQVRHITLDPAIALITGVGQTTNGDSGVPGRTLAALDRAGVQVIAVVQGLAEYSISFVVAQKHLQRALVAAHREFQLGHIKAATTSGSKPMPEIRDLVLEA